MLSGRFEDLRTIFSTIGGGSLRIQAMLIAFCSAACWRPSPASVLPWPSRPP
ncbi:hypothetical protein QJS66_18395 [Kocuria rhizophila]|nr:hypothetical protein QJS66_18395 [Kocuria rhizophila]